MERMKPISQFIKKFIMQNLLLILALYAAVCLINSIALVLIAFFHLPLSDFWAVYAIALLSGAVFGVLRHKKRLSWNLEAFRTRKVQLLIWLLLVLPTGLLAASFLSETNVMNDFVGSAEQILLPLRPWVS